MHTIYGERYKSYDPIVDPKTKEVIDDGTPKKVRLGTWADKKIANNMAENIKASVPSRSWKIWVES
jgi:hypothetical protein